MKSERNDKSWWRWVGWWLGFVWLCVFLIIGSFNLTQVEMTDYRAFLVGVEMIKDGGRRELYSVEAQQQKQQEITTNDIGEKFLPFRYPIFVVGIYELVSFLPWIWGYRVFVLINMGLWLVMVAWGWRELRSKRLKMFLLLLMSLFVPIMVTIFLAQVSIFMSILLFGVYVLGKKKKGITTGMVLSCLVMIKPHWVLLVPFLLAVFEEKKKILIGLTTALLCWLVVSVLVLGWEGLLKYPSFIVETEVWKYGYTADTMYGVMSWAIKLGDWVGVGNVNSWGWVVNGVYYVFSLAWFVNKRRYMGLEMKFWWAVVLSVLAVGHIYLYDLSVWVVPLMLGLIMYEKVQKKKYLIAAVGLFVYPLILFVRPILF